MAYVCICRYTNRAEVDNRHGLLRAELKAFGMPICDFDEMIAAHALAVGAIVVTGNTRHFTRVPGLVIENWLQDEPGHRQRPAQVWLGLRCG